nr:NADH dehydrogenase subunit 5 [Atrina pectinata]
MLNKVAWVEKGYARNVVFMPFFFMFLSVIIGAYTLYCLSKGLLVSISVEFVDLCFNGVEFGLKLSITSLAYLTALSIIVACTSTFSLSYMEGDLHEERMTDLVFVFVLSMFTVVCAENLFTMVLGWEGLGVSSYALIIYYQDKSALNAGYLTAMSMRVGDLLFIVLISVVMGVGDFSLISGLMGMGSILAVCCMTKSATIPFCAWLPAAMSAPTPVSALVHSSTLVTAGVCFLISSYSCLEGTIGQSILVFSSLITMVLAGTCALVENDLKKIVALSTMGQVGFMVFCVGVGSPMLAFFHMLVHAFVKAGMFVSVGMLIQVNDGEQDLREFDWAVVSKRPVALGGLMCGSFSLMGVPFLAGFYSKEVIMGFFNSCSYGIFYYVFFYWGLILTTSYSFRLIFSLGLKNKSKSVWIEKVSPNVATYVVMFLFIFFLFSGFPFWVLLVEDYSWYGAMLASPGFIFKLMTLAALFGIILSMMEDFRVWGKGIFSKKSWDYKKCGFFPTMWYIGWLSGQPWVGIFKTWSDWMGPSVEYWSDQVGGKGMWDLGAQWFEKVHRPVQQSDVFIPFFFMILAVIMAMVLSFFC